MDDVYTELRRKAQVCVRCGTQDARTLIGKYYCFDCLESHRERCKKSYQKNRDDVNAKNIQRIKERKSLGLCVCCGAKKENFSRTKCHKCEAIDRMRAKKRRIIAGVLSREEARQSGICYLCLKKSAVSGRTLCEDCLETARRTAENARSRRQKSNWGWTGRA